MSPKAVIIGLYLLLCGYFIFPLWYHVGMAAVGMVVPPLGDFLVRHHEGFREFMRVDTCYDLGGAWNRQMDVCTPSLQELCRDSGRVWADSITRCVEPGAETP